MEACDAIYYPMKNKKSNTALKMRKRRRLGAFIFVVVLLALAVVAVRIYNMNKPSRDAELLTLVNPWNTIPDGYWEDARGCLIPVEQIKEIDKARDELVREKVAKAKAMQTLGDSLQILDSKAYVRVYERDAHGKYVAIPLDMAAL